MRVRLTLRSADGTHDLCVTAHPGTRLGEVRLQLAGSRQLFLAGRSVVDDEVLGLGGLVDGVVLDLDHPQGLNDLAAATLRLDVISGPGAGSAISLPPGDLIVGRAPGCGLVVPDPDVSRQHAALSVSRHGLVLRDLGSTNGTTVAGRPVPVSGLPVGPGQLVRIGDTVLQVGVAGERMASTRATSEGRILLNRPPRTRPSIPANPIDLPATPAVPSPHRVPWSAALLPALAGVALAFLMHSPRFLAFALLSPLILTSTAVTDRLHGRRRYRRDLHDVRLRRADALKEVERLVATETQDRRAAHPDAPALLRSATGPGSTLWQRRRDDDDVMTLRLGLADVPSRVAVREAGTCRPAAELELAPVVLDLRLGAVGLCGPPEVVAAAGRWALAQLACAHSPDDLSIALLLSEAAGMRWAWARWLPHLGARLGVDADGRQSLVESLLAVMESRLERPSAGRWLGPWTVVLVDRSGELADLAGLARLLSDGPAVGVVAICIDSEERRLPAGCRTVVAVCGETGTRLQVREARGAHTAGVIADQVSAGWSEALARALAPIDLAEASNEGRLPDTARLLDCLDLPEPDPDVLRSRWSKADEALKAVIGVGEDGPVELDLVGDGPHTLVAGTTGAGKSEFLQSVVAGLATNYPPDSLSFVLVDYKGGAAFGDCAALPHTVGLVTDLDEYLTRRALTALTSELRRRERLFALAQVAELTTYRRSAEQKTWPLARLVLIIDEFATLVEELPEFVRGLIGVAQRGRSLGVHLILATQRPGGVVSPEIRANTSLRVALRVNDPAESQDVIGHSAAARIDKTTPGRALLRTGSTLRPIQTGQITTPSRAAQSRFTVADLDAWGRCPSEPVGECEKTDLQLLVAAAREAAALEARPEPHRPWLPPLPELVPAEVLGPVRLDAVPFARADDPQGQRQYPVTVDLENGRSILVVGAPGSGRSGALLSIALQAAAHHDADTLHIYVLDCAGGALRLLADLPHCGAVLTRDAFAGTRRLLERLQTEIAWRQTLLGQLGVGSAREAMTLGERVPRILVLLDGWEAFAAAADEFDGGRTTELWLGVMREAGPIGLSVIVTGGRAALAARLCASVATKYVLRLTDPADYALAGLNPRAVPVQMPPGRAITAESGIEIQIAVPGGSAGRNDVRQVVSDIAHRTPGPSGDSRPIRVQALPTRVTSADYPARPGVVLLGVGGDASLPIHVDLADGVRLLVAGPSRSGRSTVLALLARQTAPSRAVILAPPRSPLTAVGRELGVLVIGPHDPPDVLPDRINLILMDDSEVFLDCPVGDIVTSLLNQRADLSAAVAGRSEELALTFRGAAAAVRRARTGVLLQPGVGDGELLGVRLPRSRAVTLPGRGVLVLDQSPIGELANDSGAIALQVALP